MKQLSDSLHKFAEFLELVIAIVIAVAVIGGIIGSITQMINVGGFSNITYHGFKEFLAYILILVVGVEFILMLLTHSINRIVELVVFVIARKMLVYGGSMLDMLLASAAIAIVFATIKYLQLDNNIKE